MTRLQALAVTPILLVSLLAVGQASARWAHDPDSLATNGAPVVNSIGVSDSPRLELGFAAAVTQPVAGTAFSGVSGSLTGKWHDANLYVQSGKNRICTGSISQAGTGSEPLGWGDMGQELVWPTPNAASWSWDIPAGTTGKTFSIECAPMIYTLDMTVRHMWCLGTSGARVACDVAVPSPRLTWVCATWMTDGLCLNEPDFRASWTIA